MKWTWLTSRLSRESRCIFIRPGGSAGTLSPSSFSLLASQLGSSRGVLFPKRVGWSRRRAAAAQTALTHTLADSHAHTHTCTHTLTHTQSHARTLTHTHMNSHTRAHTHTHTHPHTFLFRKISYCDTWTMKISVCHTFIIWKHLFAIAELWKHYICLQYFNYMNILFAEHDLWKSPM